MNLSRRGFFKAAGAAFATTMAFELSSQSEALAVEPAADWKLVNTEEYTNICCYCSGGCGVICSTREGELVNIEGDPDHPVNQGGLCPKGATMFQLRNVVATFETVSNGITVNRCHGIASLGGSQQNSEEEYLINKMMRSLGVIAIDNQARV